MLHEQSNGVFPGRRSPTGWLAVGIELTLAREQGAQELRARLREGWTPRLYWTRAGDDDSEPGKAPIHAFRPSPEHPSRGRAVVFPVLAAAPLWYTLDLEDGLEIADDEGRYGSATVRWVRTLSKGLSPSQLAALSRWAADGGQPPEI